MTPSAGRKAREETEEEVVVVEPARSRGACSEARGVAGRLLLLCDHASCRLPESMGGGTGGVPDAVLKDHFGWDIGALGVARVVARELSVGLVWANFSRLVIDPNRGLAAEGLIRQDLGVAMNARVDEAERERRIASFYEPYHRAIDDVLDAEEGLKAVVAIHTFTPMWEGKPRDWQAGLIYDDERAGDAFCARALMAFLRAEGFCVGDNEPYPPLPGDSLALHGVGRGIVGVGIEVRNDLLREEKGQEAWGARLARGLTQWGEEAGVL